VLPKPEHVAVLGDVELDVLGDASRRVGPYLQRYAHVRAHDRGQALHDLLADGSRAPAEACGGYLDYAVKPSGQISDWCLDRRVIHGRAGIRTANACPPVLAFSDSALSAITLRVNRCVLFRFGLDLPPGRVGVDEDARLVYVDRRSGIAELQAFVAAVHRDGLGVAEELAGRDSVPDGLFEHPTIPEAREVEVLRQVLPEGDVLFAAPEVGV
jgi:hypothetical protein